MPGRASEPGHSSWLITPGTRSRARKATPSRIEGSRRTEAHHHRRHHSERPLKSTAEGMAALGGRDLAGERVPAEPRAAEARSILLKLEHEEGQALYGFALRLGLSETEAQDAVQEALLRLWAQLRAGTPVDRPRNWTFRTIYRIAMDEHRTRRRAMSLLDRIRLVTRPGSVSEPGRVVDVWPEVDRLTSRQRQVIYLRYQADLGFDEIGKVLGITASAARSHCTFGLAALRRRFKDEVPR